MFGKLLIKYCGFMCNLNKYVGKIEKVKRIG